MSFSSLKKNRQKALDDIAKRAEESTGKKTYGPDERIWRITKDKNQNGRAIIRFLPPPENNPEWVEIFSYGFQGPSGLWYIEKDRNTLGWDEPDPVSEIVSEIWSKHGADKDVARNKVGDRKRKKKFVTNILVVDDPAKPENNGKVFLFEFGPQVMGIIKSAMTPEFEDEQRINPFDLWDGGANFSFKVFKNQDNQVSYLKSAFMDPAPAADKTGKEYSDEELEEFYNQTYDLIEYQRSDIKSYDELLAKYNRVMGIKAKGPEKKEEPVQKEVESSFDLDDDNDTTSPVDEDSKDDALSYFQKLANED